MKNHLIHPCTDEVAAQEAAEAYVLQRLPVDEFERYEEHLLGCPRCQQAVEEFDLFLSTAREALAEYRVPRQHRKGTRARVKSASC